MTVIYGLIGLGIIIFIHETGHFIAARCCGVAVESFSIGMGPVLFHKTIKKTDYRLSLVPLGGYCGLKGQKDIQPSPDAAAQAPEDADSFFGVHPLKRILIAFAGPFFNLVFAALAFMVIALTGYTYYTTDNRIIIASEIYPEIPSAAAQAGLQTGDRIISINGKPVHYFSDISENISVRPEEIITVEADRNGEIFSTDIKPLLDRKTGAGKIGVLSWADPVIDSVAKDSPAANAGFASGDIILRIDGTPVLHTFDVYRLFQDKQTAEIEYDRNGGRYTAHIEFPENTETGTAAKPGFAFKILEVHSEQYSFGEAMIHGITETAHMFVVSVKSIGLLFRGVDLTQAVSGPVRITVMLGDMAKSGFSESFSTGLVTVLNFLALISISLFIMNLLPIPVLDGGLILFSLITLIRKKNISPRIQYVVQFAGIAVICILFAIALFGDISYLTRNN